MGIWDALTGELIGQLLKEHEGIIWDLASSPDGQTLSTAGAHGKIILCDVDVFAYEATKEQQPTEYAFQRTCSIVNRNFTMKNGPASLAMSPTASPAPNSQDQRPCPPQKNSQKEIL